MSEHLLSFTSPSLLNNVSCQPIKMMFQHKSWTLQELQVEVGHIEFETSLYLRNSTIWSVSINNSTCAFKFQVEGNGGATSPFCCQFLDMGSLWSSPATPKVYNLSTITAEHPQFEQNIKAFCQDLADDGFAVIGLEVI
jgi:hypothetical protein